MSTIKYRDVNIGKLEKALRYFTKVYRACKGESQNAQRFFIMGKSISQHCCFTHSVLDITQPNLSIDGTIYEDEYGKHYYSICECMSEEDATLVCDALNDKMGFASEREDEDMTVILDAARYRWLRRELANKLSKGQSLIGDANLTEEGLDDYIDEMINE